MATALLIVAAPAVSAHAESINGRVSTVFHLADRRLDEASGLVVGRASPGVLYAQNDSGDSARFFALNGATGQTVAVCDVPGASNIDWEDMAGGRAADGTSSLWLGDIGDNDSQRKSISIYQVNEPVLNPAAPAKHCIAPVVHTWRLRYPDGPQNAESLLYDPRGQRLYIASKSFAGRTRIYQVPAAPSEQVQSLTEVATVQFRPSGNAVGPLGPLGGLLSTGGAFSSDGTLLVLRTYSTAWVWPVSASGVAAALSAQPWVLNLPDQAQGEGVAVLAGSAPAHQQPAHQQPAPDLSLLLSSEGVGSAVLRLDVGNPSTPAASGQPAQAARADTSTNTGANIGVVASVAAICSVLAAAGLHRLRRLRG